MTLKFVINNPYVLALLMQKNSESVNIPGSSQKYPNIEANIEYDTNEEKLQIETFSPQNEHKMKRNEGEQTQYRLLLK